MIARGEIASGLRSIIVPVALQIASCEILSVRSKEEDMQAGDAFLLLFLGVGGDIEGLGRHLVRPHGVAGNYQGDLRFHVVRPAESLVRAA